MIVINAICRFERFPACVFLTLGHITDKIDRGIIKFCRDVLRIVVLDIKIAMLAALGHIFGVFDGFIGS